jgi:hypothetical protein
VLEDLGVVARRVAVWETEEACAIATAEGRVTSGLACGSAVIVDDR